MKYIEIIADPFHLHPAALDLIFRTKDHDKIIIISDSVEGTKTDKEPDAGVFDEAQHLLGGSLTVTESASRLIKMGYEKEMVMNCITRNPAMLISAG